MLFPRRLNFICRRFGTLCFFQGRYLPMRMEQPECSETSEYKIQTPRNYPEESMQHLEHGESLKSRILFSCNTTKCGHGQDIFVEVEIRKFEYKDVQLPNSFFY